MVLARQKPEHNYKKKTHTDSEESLQCSVGESELKAGWANRSWDYLTWITITPFNTTARRQNSHRKIQGSLLASELCLKKSSFKDLSDSQLHLIHPARQQDSGTSPCGSLKSSHPHVFLSLSLFSFLQIIFILCFVEVVQPGRLRVSPRT